jgi:hypothetical protein
MGLGMDLQSPQGIANKLDVPQAPKAQYCRRMQIHLKEAEGLNAEFG